MGKANKQKEGLNDPARASTLDAKTKFSMPLTYLNNKSSFSEEELL